jgi:hypothetical protein
MGSGTGWLTALIGLAFVVLVVALLIWAHRRHNRMFPKGFDRTGWSPEGDEARSYETKTTNYSGGQGTGLP